MNASNLVPKRVTSLFFALRLQEDFDRLLGFQIIHPERTQLQRKTREKSQMHPTRE